ncbi:MULTISPECIES: enoyl-CoA hydratase/isomerase family protein [unclassified Mycolicibacterium]|uniref:enoyl-CoA hydratase/isomerase family protein n=1 Tax=unclassified Mycolicibacterium TaxID=2636767 RepID=UPI00130998EF|nr:MULTISPECIES: enoyl-CoA hydratase/isomerase family protein [unclassified Mycolicibacterium]MUL85161.1 enoyl-CoA hydratase/isomerase family protein [Mycolicibacterium sp. CBMA 329]MUL91128.1 enoyl-CoA hydratase/isomerase family protein [Mycolicibacterium sp. CBMA 331]MUL98202.1 enoyl-CoA hydratase/isomerase family protein [Mycolicibacterium sp. CBMA 334]MUM26085.1 enoyl-CoA hydratase/isomerase family protein [Mycolicibacterium sp. CBMA 295]MUM40887.1 enoyl-CoA hydratase/isomerase family prot
MTENEDVLVSVRNGVGILTLNRPKAINSLSDAMVAGMSKALHAWENDDSVHTVLLTGAGERGLCAGGDVVTLYHSAKAGGADARRFWYDEYLLNAYIGRYPKPYVALMDGIVMGGGVGVAAHGSIRVATDTTKMAMPEVGIGFIPDVGGTYLLSRAPGELGLHAALTGAPFSGADAIALGFADHYVPHALLAEFTEAVVNDGVEKALATYAVEPPASPLLEQRHWIDECYAGDTVADIIAALRGHDAGTAAVAGIGGTAAVDAANLIATRSPVSLAVTLEAVRRAAKLETLEDVLHQEYRTSCASLKSHDFVEGIRAQLVDKDRNPQWRPASIAAVTAADVEAYFVPADPDLTFQEENK